MREDSLSGANGLYDQIIGQLAARHRVTRVWAYIMYKEAIDMGFKLGAIAFFYIFLIKKKKFSGSELKRWSDLYNYRGVFVTVSAGARYMVGSSMT